MRICIINYGMGNIKSVTNAIEFIGKSVDVITDSNSVKNYDIIILPGVGAFKKAMEILTKNKLDIAIKKASNDGKKIIGFCLGMQLLFSSSEEFGHSIGLNLIEGKVLPFPLDTNLLVPHMGWNKVISCKENYKDFEADYYFVHSFYCKPSDENQILFESNYGINFCSAVVKDEQIFGFQFHPEKSQKAGINLLNKILQ